MKRPLLWILVLSAISGVAWIAFSRLNDNPEQRELEYGELISKREWGDVYRRTPATIWRNTPVSESQYVKLLESVTRGLDSGKLSDYKWTRNEVPASRQLPGVHHGRLSYPSLRKWGKDPFIVYTMTFRTRDGWQVNGADLPIVLADAQAADRRGRLKILYEAMTEAGIEKYPSNATGSYLVRAGISRYIANPGLGEGVCYGTSR